jgi:hypothetical protein
MALLAASLISRGVGFGELAVLMAGLGSAAFHVGAGALTLRSCGGRSDAAGLFAAPGVIGLAIAGAITGLNAGSRALIDAVVITNRLRT